MKNRFTLSFFVAFLFLPSFIFSQGEFNNWYFGNRAGVTFNSGFPVAFTTSQLGDMTGCSSNISDSLGSILFYSGGFDVYNRNNVIMPNGSIFGMQCSVNYDQINLAVKQINDQKKYYLFTTACWQPGNSGVLRYSVIDMTLDGGNGAIPIGMNGIPIPGGMRAYHSVTGTRHHNNRDAWMVVRLQKYDSNYFSSYLVNSAGINLTPVFSLSKIILYPPPAASHGIINMRISQDGSKLLACYDSIFEFCQYDDATGHVNPLFLATLPDIDTIFQDPVNAAFSIDSKILYISGRKRWGSPPRGYLYQYDATKTDSALFVQSGVYLGNFADPPALQLAPDGKIYCTIPFVDSLNVINNPSVPGTACNFQKNVLSLKGRESGDGLPQFVERYYAIIHHTGHCQHSVSFTSSIWPPADSIHWDFGDTGSGPDNYSNLPNPFHNFSVSGDFTIHLYVRHKDNRIDTTSQSITLDPSPMPDLGPDRTVCLGDSVTWDAGYCFGCNYVWTYLTTGQPIVGFAQTYTTGVAGNYKVTVTNQFNCTGEDTVQLFTPQLPVVTNDPLSKIICTGESTSIVLTSNEPSASFHWTATLTSGNITGFTPDSGSIINQILVNNGITTGIVTYHITPEAGSCTGPPIDFPVTVNIGDSVKISISASANNVCSGTSVTFQAVPTNGGTTPSYQWKVNGIGVGPDNPVYTFVPVNGDIVSCLLTSSNTICTSNNPAVSNPVIMVIIGNSAVGVSINASANPECAGLPVTFTAMPANGGTAPFYQWKINGLNVGNNNPSYSYSPNNVDVVTCVLTSNILCPTGNPATSNTVTMTVNPNLPVSVAISASANPFCQGNPVTFTATPTNGGTTPVYQWKINGINVGLGTPVYTYNPSSGDLVSCILTSDINCPTGNPTASNTITMIQNNLLPAGVSIQASTNPFCPGNSVTFTATPVNGGANPAYQWKVNGVNSGLNSPTYIYNPISGDVVACIMTSNLSCVTANPATSNSIIMSGTLASVVTFTLCNDSITTTSAKPFKLKGGIPLGGTYSGAGVTNGIFNPALAGAGLHPITYTYTNSALCSAYASVTIVTVVTVVTSCGQNFTDIRDGEVYPTVQIGTQCWMASNLNYGAMILGNISQRDNCIPEKYCPNNLTANCGLLTADYQWDEIMNYDETISNQGLCPPAWHVPTENDWNTLFANYINNGFAASPLKYSGFSGFNALLSGARHLNKTWDYQGFATFFWSSTAHGTSKAWAHGMNDTDPSVSAYPAFRTNAYSVRCLKD